MTARRRKEKEGASFEDQLAELQRIVAALEDGDLPLLESIEQYRAGIGALKRCRELLDVARGTVEMLSREGAETSVGGAAGDATARGGDADEEAASDDEHTADEDTADEDDARGARR